MQKPGEALLEPGEAVPESAEAPAAAVL